MRCHKKMSGPRPQGIRWRPGAWSSGGACLTVGFGLILMGDRLAGAESVSEIHVSTAALIQGTFSSTPKLTFLALQSVQPAAEAGTLTAAGAGTLTDQNANWTTGQFEGNPHYIEFGSGLVADIVGTDGASRTLTISWNLEGLVSPGQSYTIRRHSTLAGVFGANNSAGLLAGANSASADNILVHRAETQQTLTYFYSNVPGFSGWYSAAYSPANNLIIRPQQGLMIRRRSSGNVVLYSGGVSRRVAPIIVVNRGFNLLGTLRAASSVTLASLNLYTGNPGTGLAGGANSSAADNLILIRPDGSSVTYFYSNYPGFEGWYDSTYLPADSATISPGTAFLLNRKPGRNAFSWTMP